MTFTVSKSCENTRESWLACDWRFVRRWSDSSEISKLYFLTLITLLLRPRFFAVYFFIILMFESTLIFIFSFNFYTPSYNFILSLPLPRNATPTLPPPPPPFFPWPPPLLPRSAHIQYIQFCLLPEDIHYLIYIFQTNWMQTLNYWGDLCITVRERAWRGPLCFIGNINS